MNFDQIKILDVVVETGSISQAAKKVFKTQPAISMAIKKLEQEIGFAIFDRTGYRLELTAKGKIYYEKSKVILSQVEQLKGLSKSFRDGEEDKVNISIEVTTNLLDVFSKLSGIQQEFPNTIINIEGSNLLYSLKKLVNEEVDLAITPWLDSFDEEGSFESKLLDDFGFNICGHKDLFAPFGVKKAEEITEGMLAKLPQIMPVEMAINSGHDYLNKQFGSSLITTNDVQCHLALMKAKLGWGPIVDSRWEDDMEKDFYRFSMDDEQPTTHGQVRIVKNKNAVLGPVAQAIWDAL